MNFEPEHSYNHGHATKMKHKQTIIEYIIYRTSGNRSIWYYGGTNEEGGPLWVESRNQAKGFDDVSSANTIAEREGGKAVKR